MLTFATPNPTTTLSLLRKVIRGGDMTEVGALAQALAPICPPLQVRPEGFYEQCDDAYMTPRRPVGAVTSDMWVDPAMEALTFA